MLYITVVNLLSFFTLFLFYGAKEPTLLYTGIILAAVNILIYMFLYRFEFGDIYLFLTVSTDFLTKLWKYIYNVSSREVLA